MSILSNGSDSVIGSLTSRWEYFTEWKKINSEGEEGIISLDTIIRGTCDKSRLLDFIENFMLYDEQQSGLIKLVGKNHQFLGVNSAVVAVQQIAQNKGHLGVFWHTQGSGKSYSMVFFAQKVLRKLPGNWTFVIVTDRQELDAQIYKTFAGVGAVTEEETQAESADHLKRLLQEDHRYVFTLIQKFRTERGAVYPKLSDRSDIIVITDEAHRSQYDIFAQNMRSALPNAAFIGFTGTPLMAGEEKTRSVFGDYVSVYNFRQSIDDGATVPLYYENRIPELQLTNTDLNEDIENLLEEAELDETQERKLEREFKREYQLITRDERLETIAEDIVTHFMGRGYKGKAMVVCVDKMTAVRMYDKVQKYWQAYLAAAGDTLSHVLDQDDRARLEQDIQFMKKTDMAVVVSQSQNEVADFRASGIDIARHRARMVKEDMETKFKDAGDPFRIVFVCAMWMTGFDAPSTSTIYLDKPMRNHTLMQTIARANRVFPDKANGLIVDYIGVFRNLQKALAIYGAPQVGGDTPIKGKHALVERLQIAINDAEKFCAEHGVHLDQLRAAQGFSFIKLRDDAVEAILVNDADKQRFLALAGDVDKLFKAILPDASASQFSPIRAVLVIISDRIRSLDPQADISSILTDLAQVLDGSVKAQQYVIPEGAADRRIDLSKIDFEALQKQFGQGRKHIETEALRALLTQKLEQMVRYNRSRLNYAETFAQMISDYNAGAANIDEFFKQLVDFTKALDEEDKRGIAEQLNEEELALFDLLTKPNPELSESERQQVKLAAHDLLVTLKREKLVLDWRKRQQTKAAVQECIQSILDKQLPPPYSPEIFADKCTTVYQHIYDSYFGEGGSVYQPAA